MQLKQKFSKFLRHEFKLENHAALSNCEQAFCQSAKRRHLNSNPHPQQNGPRAFYKNKD